MLRDTNDLDDLKNSDAANLERSQLTYKQCTYMLSGWDKFCLKYPGQICNVVFGHNYSSYYACNIPLRFTYVLWGGNWISFLPGVCTQIINHKSFIMIQKRNIKWRRIIWNKMNQKCFLCTSSAHQIIYSPFPDLHIYISHTNRCFPLKRPTRILLGLVLFRSLKESY